MQTAEYLQGISEPIPIWLECFEPGNPAPIKDFLGSRIVFYPGSGHDGQPVALFGSSHAAHCFVYADYGVSQTEVESDLNNPNTSFRGYQTLARIKIHESELTPHGWAHHLSREDIRNPTFAKGFVKPFGFMEILERLVDLDERHGPERLALLFLGADGIASYDALFCQGITNPPFGLVIQEHGFSCNYDTFGRDSLLELIATRTGTFPELLLVSANGQAWDGYDAVPNTIPTRGGMHSMERSLFKRRLN